MTKKKKPPIEQMFDNEKIVNKFLTEYGGIEEVRLAPINSYSMDILRGINDYMKGYIIFQTLSGYVYDTLEKASDDKRFASGLIRIKMSVKKQMMLQQSIKHICKNMAIPKKQQYLALKESTEKATKRLTYLYEHIIPIYMESTKLCGYYKKLQEYGKTIYQDVMDYMKCDEYDFDKEKALAYLDKMVEENPDESWEKNLDVSIANNAINEAAAKEDKKKKAKENLQKKCEDMEGILIKQSRIIDRNFRNAGFETTASPYVKMGLRVRDMNISGKRCKIVLLGSSKSRSTAGVRYYSKDVDGFITKALSKASVIIEEEELPAELLEKINNHELAFVELVLN